jgi:uncharacterized protein YggE
VHDARAKANALAAAGGFRVGRILTVSESGAPQPIAIDQAKAAGAGTPVEPGTQDITADVQVSFAIG